MMLTSSKLRQIIHRSHFNRSFPSTRRFLSAAQPTATQLSTTPPPPPHDKAALLVIGNEILSGSVTDTNTPWLAKLLWSRGVDLLNVEYIPDDEPTIISSIKRMKTTVGPTGCIFTSGGIGPTHDDITYASIAKAFNVDLQQHPPTVQKMEEHYKQRNIELNEARLRMALLPSPADDVLSTPGLWVPLAVIQSIYILPGIPRLFTSMIEANKERFKGPAALSETLLSNAGEGDLADALSLVAEQHGATVRIGSYPNTKIDMFKENRGSSGGYRVKVVFESRDEKALQGAVEAAKKVLPKLIL